MHDLLNHAMYVDEPTKLLKFDENYWEIAACKIL